LQDEEGSEDENEYQVDGFVVPEGDDDEGRKSSGKRRKKKVHKRLRRVRDISGPVSTACLLLQLATLLYLSLALQQRSMVLMMSACRVLLW
jgi:hypothetical protein